MLASDIKTAMSSLRAVKWRSALTISAIVIGIVSVVTIVSLGSGVKQQVNTQVKRAGTDLITVRPGQAVERDASGKITNVNLAYAYGFGVGSLNDEDLSAIRGVEQVGKAAPVSLIAGNLKTDDTSYNDGLIVGTSGSFGEILNQKLEYGSLFGDDDSNSQVAVIGKTVAEQLFGENVPIGRSFSIRGQEFIVRGIFTDFKPNTLALGADFNKAVFIPYPVSRSLNNGAVHVVQIVVKPNDSGQTESTAAAINNAMLEKHGGQQDFAVLTQADSITLNKRTLNVLTGILGGVAAIALLVAGIGIMNIMLVSVTERTREIGIRKAIGATNRQLLGQFWIEAITLCVIGGLFGVLFSFLTIYLIRVLTNYTPVMTWPVLVLATFVSVAVGITFGMIPAYKAAHKDPVEALRHDT